MGHSHAGHAHTPPADGRPDRRSAPLGLVLALTAAFTVVEAVGGWLSGALALLADAGHMLTDVGAIALALVSARVARRPADARRTYGYLRFEILAALANGVLLTLLAGGIVWEAVERLGEPRAIRTGLFAAVAAGGLVVNLLAARLLHAHAHDDLNTRGAYLHILGDLAGSVGALAAAGIVALTGWTAADAVASILIAALILLGAWRLLRESVEILLEAAPAHIDLTEVARAAERVPGVRGVHDLHVWTLTSGVLAMSGHVQVPDLADHPRVLADVKHAMQHFGIGHVTLQLETGGPCEGAGCGGGGRSGGQAPGGRGGADQRRSEAQ